jgi:hypothetical protein
MLALVLHGMRPEEIAGTISFRPSNRVELVIAQYGMR